MNCNLEREVSALCSAVSETPATGDLQPAEVLPPTRPRNRIAITVDAVPLVVSEVNLTSGEAHGELQRRIEASSNPVEFQVDDFLGLSDAAGYVLLDLVRLCQTRCRIQLKTAGPFWTDPFEAVLDAMEPDTNIQRSQRGLHAAEEAVVFFHPHNPGAACSRVINRARQLGLKGLNTREMQKSVRKRLASLRAGESERPPRRVLEFLSDAQVLQEARVPDGWSLSYSGIKRLDADNADDIPAPVLITGRLTDPVEGNEALQIAWYREGRWRTRVVGRGQACDARKLVEQAEYGLPVDSNTAKLLVAFLKAYEYANLDQLPKVHQSRQLGWQGTDEKQGFLWGRTYISATGDMSPVDPEAPANSWGEDQVVFRGADGGDEQLADGFRANGTWEAWLAGMQALVLHPRVQLAVYASLVPPLLGLLNAENFILDYCGETSNGKTTTQQTAASVWGNPDFRSTSAAVATWDSSRVWIERSSATRNNLPLILDDTMRARDKEHIAQTLYDVANGRGRGRGTIKGTQPVQSWTTVMITSGEARVTSYSEDGGTRSRVLSLWGSPFSVKDATLVTDLRRCVLENYGHAGPRFVQYLIKHRDQKPIWRAKYEELRKKFCETATDKTIGSRIADHLAVLSLCVELANTALGLPWSDQNPVDKLAKEFQTEAGDSDQPKAALLHALSWACSHQHEFFGRENKFHNIPTTPTAGWAGRWDPENKRWKYLGFMQDTLRKVLEGRGFEYDAIIQAWKDRGWLLCDSKGRPRYSARVDDVPTWLHAIPRQVVESEGGHQDEPDSEDGAPAGFRTLAAGPKSLTMPPMPRLAS